MMRGWRGVTENEACGQKLAAKPQTGKRPQVRLLFDLSLPNTSSVAGELRGIVQSFRCAGGLGGMALSAFQYHTWSREQGTEVQGGKARAKWS